MADNETEKGVQSWLNGSERGDGWAGALTGIRALKEIAAEDLAYAVETGDHRLYQRTLNALEGKAGNYADILNHGTGEIPVEERLEPPGAIETLDMHAPVESKRQYLEQAAGFTDRYEQAIEEAEGASDAAMSLAEDLLEYHRKLQETAVDHTGTDTSIFMEMDSVSEKMASLLREKQPAAP